MTINELRKKGGFLRGDRYALALVFGARDAAGFDQELREAKPALLDWFSRRGKAGDMVRVVIPNREVHAHAESTLRQIVADEQDLAAPLQQRTVLVSFLGPGAIADRELTWAKGAWVQA